MPTKRRIALPPNHEVHNLTVAPHVKLGDPISGSVTFLDKAKGYYKGLIAALTALLVIVNEVTPVLNFLPGQDKQYVTAAIAVVGVALTFLKDNEHFVDDL